MELPTRLVVIFALALGAGSIACSDGGGGGGGGTGGSGGTGGGSGGVPGSGGATTGSGGAATGSGGAGGAGGTGGSDAGATGTGGSPGDGSSDRPADTAAEVGSDGGAGDTAAAAFLFRCAGLVQMGDRLVFPPRHSAPTNQSPLFTWGTPPAGTMSIAITLSDRSNGNGHWAIWNIPATETMLAAGIPGGMMPGAPAPQGARQNNGFFGPGGGGVNNYELRIWALKAPMYTYPGSPATMRDRLLQDFMGPKTLVLESQVIMAQGTRGGIGMNP
jgi:phosphatidylethanolamine-binding protein (PEBP) family uncharacterized protein